MYIILWVKWLGSLFSRQLSRNRMGFFVLFCESSFLFQLFKILVPFIPDNDNICLGSLIIDLQDQVKLQQDRYTKILLTIVFWYINLLINITYYLFVINRYVLSIFLIYLTQYINIVTQYIPYISCIQLFDVWLLMVTPGYKRQSMLSGNRITQDTKFCTTSTFNRLNEGIRKNEQERVRMESFLYRNRSFGTIRS